MNKPCVFCVAFSLAMQTAIALSGGVLAAASASSAAGPGLSATPRRVNASGACPEASVSITPLPGGQARLELGSPCRASQEVKILYAGLQFFPRLDGDGRLEFIFDCIAGPQELARFTFLDGGTLQRPVLTRDLNQVTKVAVAWRGAINLDLHAFEYAARFGQPGHVWARAASSLAEAQAAAQRDGRSHGFMSALANGHTKGDQLEVYTLWRGKAQTARGASGGAVGGIISMAVDYESREAEPQDADTCGSGLFAQVDYDIIIREASGVTKHANGVFSPLACGVRLQKASRYNTKSIPYIIK